MPERLGHRADDDEAMLAPESKGGCVRGGDEVELHGEESRGARGLHGGFAQ